MTSIHPKAVKWTKQLPSSCGPTTGSSSRIGITHTDVTGAWFVEIQSQTFGPFKTERQAQLFGEKFIANGFDDSNIKLPPKLSSPAA